MAARESLGLATGCREFWTVDERRRKIIAATRDGRRRAYESGDSIPLPLFGDALVDVDALLGRALDCPSRYTFAGTMYGAR